MSQSAQIMQPGPFVIGTKSDQWSSGICDCFEDKLLCCFAFWCLPCFACKTASDAGQCLCLPLLDCFGIIPPITTAIRVSVRQRYDIEGNICNDCIYSFCCAACSWCQVARELKIRKAALIA